MKKYKVSFRVFTYKPFMNCFDQKYIGIFAFFVKCDDDETAITKAFNKLFKIFSVERCSIEEICVQCVRG